MVVIPAISRSCNHWDLSFLELRGFVKRGLSLNEDGKVVVQVQKVNGWKASLGEVHLQKIENQVH